MSPTQRIEKDTFFPACRPVLNASLKGCTKISFPSPENSLCVFWFCCLLMSPAGVFILLHDSIDSQATRIASLSPGVNLALPPNCYSDSAVCQGVLQEYSYCCTILLIFKRSVYQPARRATLPHWANPCNSATCYHPDSAVCRRVLQEYSYCCTIQRYSNNQFSK